jgi:hypothetical protein
MSEWIETKVRLPEQYVPVLAAHPFGGGAIFDIVEWGGRRWAVIGKDTSYDKYYYAHWQPLPDPPQLKHFYWEKVTITSRGLNGPGLLFERGKPKQGVPLPSLDDADATDLVDWLNRIWPIP